MEFVAAARLEPSRPGPVAEPLVNEPPWILSIQIESIGRQGGDSTIKTYHNKLGALLPAEIVLGTYSITDRQSSLNAEGSISSCGHAKGSWDGSVLPFLETHHQYFATLQVNILAHGSCQDVATVESCHRAASP